MIEDSELLRRYAREHAEDAFAELVRRHIDVVYAAAWRQCQGDAAHAQDVTQLVFSELARRSAALVHHPALLGWLHTTTRFTAMKILRTESRRSAREQQAAALDALHADVDPPVDWDRLHPLLDTVLGELKDRERAAILLRFFESKSLNEVGATLHLSETAARSCVNRALDKMRDRLARRGFNSTTAALGLALANQVTAAAPAGLAASVTSAAVAITTADGTALIALLTMKKVILGIAGILLLAEFTTATVELKTKRLLDSEYQELQRAPNRPATPPPLAPNVAAAPTAIPSATITGETIELTQLRRRLAELKARPAGVVDSQLQPPANVGRSTAQNAMKTMEWTVAAGDMEALTHFATFSDDTPENRAAFMANFSEAIRARYQTPERLVMAVSFAEALRDPPVSLQVIDSHTYYTGLQNVGAWVRYASGREEKISPPFQETPNGWVLMPLSLTGKNSAVAYAQARLDPATGDVLPPKK
jgi:RNA polymerase sigma factor (sigma-70 family)